MKPRKKSVDKPKKARRASVLTRELKARWINAFGAEVRRRREARRMTLETLARRAGLSEGFIGFVERGEREPSLSTILALSAGLECEPYELFGSTLSPPALEVALSFDRCQDERARKAIVKVLRTVERARSATKSTE